MFYNTSSTAYRLNNSARRNARPAGERKREGIKSLGLHNELGLSDSRSVMGKRVSESDWFGVSHASHTFGGRRIEGPQGGHRCLPTLARPLGLHMHQSYAQMDALTGGDQGWDGLVWEILLSQKSLSE